MLSKPLSNKHDIISLLQQITVRVIVGKDI
jgi:hypothetical protein